MYRIDEDRIYSEIERLKPKSVLFSSPEGLLSNVQKIVSKVEERYGIRAYLLAETCYGICDTSNNEARILNADIAFHIGHTVSVKKMGERTVLIDAFDDISFDKVLTKALSTLKRFRSVGICSLSQHIHQIDHARGFLKSQGLQTVIGGGRGLLKNGQVFGCDFYSAFNIRDAVDAFIFLGQSRFHAVGIALSTGKPTFMLDPYLNIVENMNNLSDQIYKKAVLAVYKAVEAEKFGIVVGLKEGQIDLKRAEQLGARLKSLGRKVEFIALREITDERLTSLKNIDAFIQTACPRISIDGYTFSKPVLSTLQAEALIQMIEGKDLKDFFIRADWH